MNTAEPKLDMDELVDHFRSAVRAGKKDAKPSPKTKAAKAPEAGSEEQKKDDQTDAVRKPDDAVDRAEATTEGDAPAVVDAYHGRGGLYVVVRGKRQLLNRTE